MNNLIYSKLSNDIVSLYKKEGDIGKSNFDFKKNLEIDKDNIYNNYHKIKATNNINRQQYINYITNNFI